MDMRKLKKNPSDDIKYATRLLKERDKSRDSGDNLAKDIMEIIKIHPEISPKVYKKLEKAIAKYSNSEGWNPGFEFADWK